MDLHVCVATLLPSYAKLWKEHDVSTMMGMAIIATPKVAMPS
jgi:hypothetical protein